MTDDITAHVAERSVQASIKFGGNGSLYLIAKAGTPEELLEDLAVLAENAVIINTNCEEIQRSGSLQEAFPGSNIIQQQQQATTRPQQAARPAPQQGQQGSLCAHGVPRSVRSGNKNGKAWTGEFCVVKNDPNMPECPAIFRN